MKKVFSFLILWTSLLVYGQEFENNWVFSEITTIEGVEVVPHIREMFFI
ncbi:hypothetical protein [Tenacibaculum sp. SG-28]|nr:hypothetical protein [Tenacibaculum sp. SG-28]